MKKLKRRGWKLHCNNLCLLQLISVAGCIAFNASLLRACKRFKSLHFIFVIEEKFFVTFPREKILNNAKRDTENEIREKECFMAEALFEKKRNDKKFYDFFLFKYARNLNLYNKKVG